MDIKRVINKIHGWIADCDPNFIWFKELGWPETINGQNAFELKDTEGNRFVITVTKAE